MVAAQYRRRWCSLLAAQDQPISGAKEMLWQKAGAVSDVTGGPVRAFVGYHHRSPYPLIPEKRLLKQLLPLKLLATLAGSVATASFAMAGLTTAPAEAVSLDQACAMFAAKIQDALSAGDTAKAQMIFSEGSQRIASRFNGASCPNIQAP
jgi:hypothetical protein